MIQLKPEIDIEIRCPRCDSAVRPNDWRITGMHSMCTITCATCQGDFFLELPVNSGLFYPGILDTKTGKRCDRIPLKNWYLTGLEAAFKRRSRQKVKLDVISKRPIGSKPVLILNTIDATYGHGLYQLFNADYYLKDTDYDLVVLIQPALVWLVPEGVAQIWVADLSFSQADGWFDDLADRIKELVKDIPTVYLCRSFQQVDSTEFSIEHYTRIAPFPLNEWNARLAAPTVTFIWRTDRFWRKLLPGLIDNRVTAKLFPRLLQYLRNYVQFRWIIRFSHALKKEIPNIDFAIAGMDERKPALPPWVKDFRQPVHEDDKAREQVRRYAESHLVVGCNGSSLLLPGCMSGAILNLVPGDQWAVSAGTFPFRVTSIGDTHFRYTMVPAEVKIRRLVGIAVSMLRDRAYVEIQTSHPWRDHKASLDHFAWSRYRQEAFKVSENFASQKGMISVKKDD